MSLRKVAWELAHRATRAGQIGRVASSAELIELTKAFAGRYPLWLAELIAEVPLCGIRLGWTDQTPRDPDDIRWAVWSTPQRVQLESLKTEYPGMLILPLGYINVAEDGNQSGNPYFVLADGNPDPAIYRIYHDGGSTGEELVAEAKLVARSLSEFFHNALVKVPPEIDWDADDESV